ncbi:WD40-repeat-containing domain protein [Dichotomopilus funicola]|uniref:WD40-repeat-containing domain protein n=1 Tax=Dichotomopilus funicola TaxID=1934379 RepID=A0AAN6V4K4_9PEZI|nr:WD40-repeat-containing domain protein [Dichotomopilus funicola]
MSQPARPRLPRIPKEMFSPHFKDIHNQPYHESTTSARSGAAAHHKLRHIAWNPLGTVVATVTTDKTIRAWIAGKPELRYSTEFRGHTATIEKIAFNPAKETELGSVSNDGVVRLWDVRTKACVNEIEGMGSAHSLAWAPDGSSLLVANRSGELFQVSPAKSAIIATHQLPTEVNQLAFCWSGEKVFLPMADGTVRILSYPDLEPVVHVNHAVKEGESSEFMLKGHTAACLTTEVSPTGRYVATGGADSIIGLFDTKDWICQRTISRMVGPVKCLSFSFDGSYLVAGCEEGSGIEVTHAESGELIHTFKTAGPCEAVAWSPTRYCLAYGDLGVLRIIDADKKSKGS